MSIENKKLLFLFGCIPIRIILSLIPLYIDISYLPYYGIILLIITIVFLYEYFNNLRLDATEAQGVTWWKDYRLIHGLLYLCAAIYALLKKRLAWIPLTIDVVLGLVLFMVRYIL